MLRSRLPLVILGLSLSLMSLACGRTPAPQASPGPVSLPVTPAPDSSPPAASPALVPSPTRSPDSTPRTGTGPLVILPGNAGELLELDRLGKGALQAAPVFSPDGERLAIPTAAGVYIHDAHTFDELYRISPGTGFMAFSPDGRRLATSGGHSVLLWALADGALLSELPASQDVWIWELAFSPDGGLLAAHTSGMQTLIWSVASGEQLYTFNGSSLEFSPDGGLAAVDILGEGRAYLYDLEEGKEVNYWEATASGFVPDGRMWLAQGEEVRLLDFAGDTLSPPFAGSLPSFSLDGNLMALFWRESLYIYDSHKGRRTALLEGDYARVDQLLFSPDGQTAAGDVYVRKCPTCTEIEGLDRFSVLWRLADGVIIAQLPHPSGWIAYSTDGSILALAQVEELQFFSAADGLPVTSIDGFTAPVAGMSVSPDGNTLAVVHASEPYTLRFWDLITGRLKRELANKLDAVIDNNVDVAYSPDGKSLVVGGHLWDLETGDHLLELEQAIVDRTSCWSTSAAFSPQVDTLATGCFEGQLNLWNLADGALVQSLQGYQSWVDDLAFSPGGERLAAVYGVPDYLVQVWGLPDGKPAFTLRGGHFLRVHYSPDGLTLATIAANPDYEQYGQPAGFVQLWSAAGGQELSSLELDNAVSLAFSPDSQLLATGSFDGILRLWETAGNQLLWETRAGREPLNQLSFTPDGSLLIAISWDGTTSIWGIPAEGASGKSSVGVGWQTYTSERFGFSLDFPVGWQVLEVPNAEYQTDIPQVWFSSSGFPRPQTGARADIVLMVLEWDPAQDWGPDKFVRYQAETIRIGRREALKISGFNKESLSEETSLIIKIGDNFLLAIPNQSAESIRYFDRVLSTLR